MSLGFHGPGRRSDERVRAEGEREEVQIRQVPRLGQTEPRRPVRQLGEPLLRREPVLRMQKGKNQRARILYAQ